MFGKTYKYHSRKSSRISNYLVWREITGRINSRPNPISRSLYISVLLMLFAWWCSRRSYSPLQKLEVRRIVQIGQWTDWFSISSVENTRRLIFDTLQEYGIDAKSANIVFVTDNGSNLIAALDGEAHLRCVCHCINLALQHAIKSSTTIENTLVACRSVVTHFKRCELQQKIPTSLKQDVDTRWNSICDMLQSIIVVQQEVVNLLIDRKEEFLFEAIDMQLIKQLVNLLSPFKTGSEILSSDREPTLHLVLPFFKRFKECCNIRKEDLTPITEIKRALSEKLNEKLWLGELHYIATFLHPETKSLSVRLIVDA